MSLEKNTLNYTTSPDIHSGDQQSTKQLDPILHEENTEGAKLKVRKKPEKKSYILELLKKLLL